MSIDTEYAVRRELRNNLVLREVDSRQRGELRRTLLLVGLSVLVLLFSAWQRSGVRQHMREIEDLRLALEQERVLNRQFRLNVETLRSPQRIEERARALGLRPPVLGETLVIERVPEPPPADGVVARAH